MTTPNITGPGWNPYYGDFAWEIGGGVWNYGQSLTEDDIAMIIHGPRADPGNVTALFQDKLLQQPLEVLRMFQPFIPGSTMDDFPDIPVSVSTIMKWLPTNKLLVKVEDALKWVEEQFKPVQESLDQLFKDIQKWLKDVFKPLEQNFNKLVSDIDKWLEGVFDPLEESVHKLQADFAKLVADIQKWLKDVFDPFKASFDKLVKNIEQWLKDVFQPLEDSFNKLVDDIEQWLKDVFKPVEDGLNNLIADIDQWLDDTFGPLTDKVQSIIDSIIQGFHAWWDQNGFSDQDVKDFSNNVAQAIGTIGTLGIRLSKLEGSQAKVLEDFTTYPNDSTTLGSKWFQYYVGNGGGTLGVVNDYALFSLALGTNNKLAFAIHKTSTESDLHRVAAPVSTPQSGLVEKSANILVARAALVTNTDMIYARMEGAKAEIGYVKAGKATVLGAVPNFKFKNGAVYSLDCTEQRTYKLFENDTEILRVVDSAGAATTGTNNRYVGFGVYAPNGTLRPGVYGSLAAFVK